MNTRCTILIAPDSFKESLPAWEVAAAIERGWRKAAPDDEITCLPMADGGDGTLEVLVRATNGTRHTKTVTGPLGEPVEAAWGTMDDGTAVIEMAAASGLHLVPPDRRDPRIATSRGTGELIAAALDSGCSEILVTLGGSATNDGGAGMASALGYRFLDADGNELPDGGAALAHLATIDDSNRHPGLDSALISAMSDVTNPLLGPQGASAVYGPQKGANPEMVAELEGALAHYARVVLETTGGDRPANPDAFAGAGAAGGMGFGLMSLCNASIAPGFERIAEICSLDDALARADLVITGEGRLDGQSGMGKLCSGMARKSADHGVPCVALAGALDGDLSSLHSLGLNAAFSITPAGMPLDEAMARTAAHLEAAGENLARLWHAQ